MLRVVLQERVVDRAVGQVFQNEFAGEGPGLDLGQDALHLMPGIVGDDAPAPGDIAVLGGGGNPVPHARNALLVDQVHDQFHFVETLKIGHLGLVARGHQGLKTRPDELGQAAAKDHLFPEKVGLGLFFKGGLQNAGAGAADGLSVGQGDLQGVAGGVLVDGHQGRDSLAFHIGRADQVTRALGGDHEHVHIRRGDDLAEMDIEAVGEHEGLAALEVRLDVGLVDVGLQVILGQDLDDVRLGRDLPGVRDLEAIRPGLLDGLFGALADEHLDARILQVQGLVTALVAVADDADCFSFQNIQIRVLLVIDLRHFILLGCFARKRVFLLQEPHAALDGPRSAQRLLKVGLSGLSSLHFDLLFLFLMDFLAPGNGHFPGANHLDNAIVLQKLDHAVDLALLARDFDDEAFQGHVHDLPVKATHNLHDLATRRGIGFHLDEGQVPGDEIVLGQVDHPDGIHQLVELFFDLVDDTVVAPDHDGHTRHLGIVGHPDHQAVDVIASGREKVGHPGQDPAVIVDQNRDGMSHLRSPFALAA